MVDAAVNPDAAGAVGDGGRDDGSAAALGFRLTVRYAIVLIVLAALAVSAYTINHAVIVSSQDSAALINVSGRQRMLSQRIVMYGQMLVEHAGAYRRDSVRDSLVAAADLMEASHRGLILGDPAKGLRGENSQAVRALFFGPERRVDLDVTTFLHHARNLAAKPDELLHWSDPDLQYLLLNGPTGLLAGLDAIVARYQTEADARVSTLVEVQRVALVLSLLVLLVTALAVFRPMVRRMQSEMEAQEVTRRHLSGILNSVGEGIITIDRKGLIESFNPAAERMFGRAEDEVVGTCLLDLMGADGEVDCRDLVGRILETVATEGIDSGCEAVGVRADGAGFFVELAISRMRVDGSLRFTAVVRDITERRRADERQRLAAQVMQSGLHGITITDAANRILEVNEAFTRTTGYDRDEVVGQTPSLLSSGRHDKEFYARMWRSITTTGHWAGEIWNRRKNGEVYPQYLEISAVRNAEGDVTNYVAVFTDITKIKAADEQLSLYARELESKNLELREAVIKANEANRAKSEFLAAMSHELRTPLNAIIGFSEAMGLEVFGPLGNERYSEYMGSISDSGRHLLSVINDILDVSKVETGSVELMEGETDVYEVTMAAVRLVRERARREKLSLDVDIPADLPKVRADQRRIKQVLLNLLANAVKFTPAGGAVAVMARIEPDGRLMVAVSDTGIGIAPEDIAVALSPFGQVDSRLARRYEGTGLGLPLSKGLVELHGGTLGVESELGKGTTIRLHFPAARVIQEPGAALLSGNIEAKR